MPDFPVVLILAGGLGTRLGPEHAALPKSMVDVNGTPFIAHQLHLLKKKGVDEVILCLGHQAKPLQEYAGNGEKFGIRLHYCCDYEQDAPSPGSSSALLGTGGAILKASAQVDSPFAVVYGDSWLDTAYAPVFQSFKRLNKQALITAYKNKNKKIPSNLLVKNGQVLVYDKEQKTSGMEHVDYGLTIFSKAAFAGFEQGSVFDLGQVIQKLISEGQLACHEVNEPFYEVGSVAGLAELKQHLRQLALNSQGRSACD